MNIDSLYSREKVLNTTCGPVDLTTCRWKTLFSNNRRKKDIAELPTHGYVHAIVELRGALYAIIGPDTARPQTVKNISFRISIVTALKVINGKCGSRQIIFYRNRGIHLDLPPIKINYICSVAATKRRILMTLISLIT
jgi:hypothetical protein